MYLVLFVSDMHIVEILTVNFPAQQQNISKFLLLHYKWSCSRKIAVIYATEFQTNNL